MLSIILYEKKKKKRKKKYINVFLGQYGLWDMCARLLYMHLEAKVAGVAPGQPSQEYEGKHNNVLGKPR